MKNLEKTTIKERLYNEIANNPDSEYGTEYEREFQYIRKMDVRTKDLFIHEIIDLYRYNDWLESSIGGFAEIFNVYARSKEFERLPEDSKLTFLENQYLMYDLLKEIENLSSNYGIGKYS